MLNGHFRNAPLRCGKHRVDKNDDRLRALRQCLEGGINVFGKPNLPEEQLDGLLPTTGLEPVTR